MIRVTVEVIRGSEHFTEQVRADSIERAVKVAGVRYPDGKIRVQFPIEPEIFFAEELVPVGTARWGATG